MKSLFILWITDRLLEIWSWCGGGGISGGVSGCSVSDGGGVVMVV